jgi:hypothetical protein
MMFLDYLAHKGCNKDLFHTMVREIYNVPLLKQMALPVGITKVM